jgi:hypothetical protein
MGQAKQRGNFDQRKVKAEKTQRRIQKMPPYGSLLHAPSHVRQGFLDKHGLAQIKARTDKRHQEEMAIFLKVLLAFSEPLDTTLKINNIDLVENFKFKTDAMLWTFRGSFLDIVAVTLFDSEKVPHIFINEEFHRDNDDEYKNYELLDSLIHEMAHATGPRLGRWNIDQQPSLSDINESTVLPYAIEEFIAITTASKLVSDFFDIPDGKSKKIRSDAINEVVDRLELSPEEVGKIDWNYVESSTQKVTNFLVDATAIRA